MDGAQLPYFVDPLPTTGDFLPVAVGKLKDTRLQALRAFPEAYMSTFAREEEFTDAQWIENIRDPNHHYLICHTSPQLGENSAHTPIIAADDWPEKDEWVGMLLLIGPFTKEKYGAYPFVRQDIGLDEQETRWHLTGLYLQPESRCKNSDVAMHEAVLSYLRSWTDDHLDTIFDEATGLERPKRARLAGIIVTSNPLLEEMYRALNGQEVGWADRKLGLRIAGIEEEFLDEGVEEVFYAQVMERVIEC
ncbi:hypothetical protein MMC21_007067 [Puttea exsequens]|nr:hypothetical protein [Puttea exsequens]